MDLFISIFGTMLAILLAGGGVVLLVSEVVISRRDRYRIDRLIVGIAVGCLVAGGLLTKFVILN
jgi:uncharacterized membrane protein YqjE